MHHAQRFARLQVKLRVALRRAACTDTDIERLLMRNKRTGWKWRVPSNATAKLRSLAALPTSDTKDVTARRCAVTRAVDGKVSQEIARQLSAMRRPVHVTAHFILEKIVVGRGFFFGRGR